VYTRIVCSDVHVPWYVCGLSLDETKPSDKYELINSNITSTHQQYQGRSAYLVSNTPYGLCRYPRACHLANNNQYTLPLVYELFTESDSAEKLSYESVKQFSAQVSIRREFLFEVTES